MTNKSTNNKKFLFSVVIPIYNCEEYLPDAMESLVNQTIGFEDNIQVILVNDGSTDNSKNVCLEYCAKYPDNVSYHEQPNSGVSAARNLGMKYVQGEYVNFLDADDKWQDDVFEKAEKMFRKHPEMDVIGVRQHNFEASDEYRPLDYKFDRDKVVDIFNEYDHLQLSVTSAFFRALQLDNTRFDTEVKYTEDGKFILSILMKKGKLGVISTSEHMYRVRNSNGSALQTKNNDIDWYTTTPKRVYEWAIDQSIKKYGFVIPYVQYMIMYDCQWRAKEHIPPSIPKDIRNRYIETIRHILGYIDDRIILEQKQIWSEYKFEFMKFKYGSQAFKHLTYKHHVVYFDNIYLLNLRNKATIKLNTLSIAGDTITFAGTVNCYLPTSDYKLYATINGNDQKVDLIKTDIYTRYFFNKPFISNYGFKIKTSKNTFRSLSFKSVYKELYISNMSFSDGIQFKIGADKGLYYQSNRKIFYCNKRKIICVNKTFRRTISAYVRCDRWLKRKKRNDMRRLRLITLIRRKALRLLSHRIWLLSDRPNVANDNGAALFEYICQNKPKNITPIFILDKTSSDYKKMRRIGKVVEYNTKKYRRLFLLADKIISSQADEWVLNPYGKDADYIKDLYPRHFIFLQHGITKDDISSWISVFTKNLSGICCASLLELDSINFNEKYNFDDRTVWLTGFARYDKLHSKPNGQIIVAPTWRKDLALPANPNTGIRPRSNKLISSDYYKFYNDLINDDRILKLAKKTGMKINLLLHPAFSKNVKDFKVSDETIINITTNPDYSRYFSEGNLLITDYSSVAFDFAYLQKPIIYTQFDKDEFFANHLYKPGYFSYEENGFGPVCYDYESAVREICRQIESSCKMPNRYKKRVDSTFAFHDKNNCKRILDAILNGGTK